MKASDDLDLDSGQHEEAVSNILVSYAGCSEQREGDDTMELERREENAVSFFSFSGRRNPSSILRNSLSETVDSVVFVLNILRSETTDTANQGMGVDVYDGHAVDRELHLRCV